MNRQSSSIEDFVKQLPVLLEGYLDPEKYEIKTDEPDELKIMIATMQQDISAWAGIAQHMASSFVQVNEKTEGWDEEMKTLRSQIKRLKKENKALNQDLDKKNQMIDIIQTDIVEKDQNLSNLDEQNKNMVGKIDRMTRDADKMYEELEMAKQKPPSERARRMSNVIQDPSIPLKIQADLLAQIAELDSVSKNQETQISQLRLQLAEAQLNFEEEKRKNEEALDKIKHLHSEASTQNFKLELQTENAAALEEKLKEAEIARIQSNRKNKIMVIGEEEDEDSFSSSDDEMDGSSAPLPRLSGEFLPRLSGFTGNNESMSKAAIFFSPKIEQTSRKFDFSDFQNTTEISTQTEDELYQKDIQNLEDMPKMDSFELIENSSQASVKSYNDVEIQVDTFELSEVEIQATQESTQMDTQTHRAQLIDWLVQSDKIQNDEKPQFEDSILKTEIEEKQTVELQVQTDVIEIKESNIQVQPGQLEAAVQTDGEPSTPIPTQIAIQKDLKISPNIIMLEKVPANSIAFEIQEQLMPFDMQSQSDVSTEEGRAGRRRMRAQGRRKDPVEEYFILTCQAAKLNSPNMEKIATLPVNDLYRRALQDGIPFFYWHDWVARELEELASTL